MFAVTVPKPLPHQLPVLNSPARFKLMACGRRWAKSSAGLQMIVRGHGGRHKGMLQGGRLLWVAPSAPQLEASRIWPDLQRCFEGLRAAKLCEIRQDTRSIVIPNGGSVTVKCVGEPGSLRGSGLDGVILDEAAWIPKDVWTDSIRPSLADKQGWAAFLTSPNGKNWIYKLKERASTRQDWEVWQRPSSDNPLVTAAELEAIRDEIGPIKFAQEHLAQFNDIEGALFPSDYFGDWLWCDGDDWPDQFEMSVMFVDPSIGSESRPGDYSAIQWLGLTGGNVHVDSNLERRPPIKIVEDTIDMFQRLQPSLVGVESNGFQAVLSDLFDLVCRARGIPPLPLVPVHHSENKGIRIQRLDPYLFRKKLRFKRSKSAEITVDQTQMFQPKGSKEHDDGPDALEGGIRLLNELAVRIGGSDD